uniref:Auxin-responsive family protein n=1 Tax=Populus trichocarpa TaxID=3694 RepID=B9HRD3_POPTR
MNLTCSCFLLSISAQIQFFGEIQKKRFVIPVPYLNQPIFQDLLSQAEEQLGYDHPMGGLTSPCREGIFMDVISCLNIPKGFLAVCIGEIEKKRSVVPLSYLKEPSFQDLLNKAEEEFGFSHPMGGLKIPCREDTSIDVLSSLSRS